MTQWRKSSRSNSSGGACVEVASLGTPGGGGGAGGGAGAGAVGLGVGVGVRDSKAPDAGHLTLSATAFTSLISRVKRAELDL